MKYLNSFEDISKAIGEIDTKVTSMLTRNRDMHGLRLTNADKSQAGRDYVTRNELKDAGILTEDSKIAGSTTTIIQGGGSGSGSGSQTPWTSNIDGGNFYLCNVKSLGVNVNCPPSCSLDVGGSPSLGLPALCLRLRGDPAVNNTQIRFFGGNANADLWAIGTDVATNNRSKDFHFFDMTSSIPLLTLKQGIGIEVKVSTVGGVSPIASLMNQTSTAIGASARLRFGSDLSFFATPTNCPYVEGICESTSGYSGLGFGTYGANGLKERLRITAAGYADYNGFFRVIGFDYPTTGQGVEINYNPSNSSGNIQTYSRTSDGFQPLSINAKPLSLCLNGDGMVGVGTSNPISPVEVWSNAASGVFVMGGNNACGVGLISWGNCGSIQGYDQIHPTTGARLAINPAGGYVGVAINNPTDVLDLNGNMRIRFGSVGAGIWYDGQTLSRNVFFGSESSGDTVFRLWNGYPGQGYNALSLYLDTGNFNIAKKLGFNTSLIPDTITISQLGQYGQLRMTYGNYGVIFRNDGVNFHVMTTANGDPYGSWKNPIPMYIDLATCRININAGFNLNGIGNYASDAAAAGGGVPVSGIYHNSGVLRIRIS